MEFKNPEKWWKRQDHRKVGGARGARFLSLTGHAVVGVAVLGMFEYVMRADDFPLYRAPPPPVEAPPPMKKSLTYALTCESPYLKQLECEDRPPAHVPHADLDFEVLRTGSKAKA